MSRSRVTHRSVHPGKRVLVKLRDGTVFEDRYTGGGSTFVVLEAYGRLPHDQLSALMLLKRRGVIDR